MPGSRDCFNTSQLKVPAHGHWTLTSSEAWVANGTSTPYKLPSDSFILY